MCIRDRLCQKLGRNVPHRGWTKGEVINTFRDIFRRNAYGKKLILIVILDEIDKFASYINNLIDEKLETMVLQFKNVGIDICLLYTS